MVHCLFTINRHIDKQHIISIVFLDPPRVERTGDQRHLFQGNNGIYVQTEVEQGNKSNFGAQGT